MAGLKRVLKIEVDRRLKEKLKAQALLIRKLGEALKITWEEYGRIFEEVTPYDIQQRIDAYHAWLKENPEGE